jgi:hypothetical protein
MEHGEKNKGATLQAPIWVDNVVGHQAFPVEGTDAALGTLVIREHKPAEQPTD